MSDPAHALGVYLHLVRAAERRKQPFVRSRMLVLAGAVAADLQQTALANYCRKQILRHNPRHMLRRWPDFEEALLDDEFLSLMRQLRRRFPLEKSERMLETLGIEVVLPEDEGVLRFAANILGVDVQQLDEDFEDPVILAALLSYLGARPVNEAGLSFIEVCCDLMFCSDCPWRT